MKLILIGLTLTLWILWCPAYTQTDSTYCLPILKARLLVADALRLKVSEALNGSLSARVDLLQSQQITDRNSFTNLLKIEQDKLQIQKEITTHTSGLSESYKEQLAYCQKKDRKHRRQRNVLIAAVVLVTGLAITN